MPGIDEIGGICRACGGCCCKDNLDITMEAIIREAIFNGEPYTGPIPDTSDFIPEISHSLEALMRPRVICPFLGDEGCTIPRERRPQICLDYKCNLYVLAEKNPDMIEPCAQYGQYKVSHLSLISRAHVFCKPGCPHADKCLVPSHCRSIKKEEADVVVH